MSKSHQVELGYNYLDTSFTGRRNKNLKGLKGLFDILDEDKGTASPLESKEFRSPGCKPKNKSTK